MKGRALVVLLVVAALVVVLDLWTKAVAVDRLVLGQPVSIVGDNVRLTLVYNTGTVWGLFPGNRIPFIVFSVVAIGVILWMFWRTPVAGGWHTVAMALLLGGALGNLHDRVRAGEVTDFIQVGVGGHYWPVFNVADSAITVGVTLLLASLMFGGSSAVEPPASALEEGAETRV